MDHNKLWKILKEKRWEYQTTRPASWEICTQIKKQQLQLDVEQWTGSKLGKEYVKAVYCHPACLTCRMLCLVAQLCPTLCYPMDCSSSHTQFSSGREDSPGKNAGVGCHALLQGIFLTQGLNPGLLHCRWLLYHLSHQGNPVCRIYCVNCWAGWSTSWNQDCPEKYQ